MLESIILLGVLVVFAVPVVHALVVKDSAKGYAVVKA